VITAYDLYPIRNLVSAQFRSLEEVDRRALLRNVKSPPLIMKLLSEAVDWLVGLCRIHDRAYYEHKQIHIMPAFVTDIYRLFDQFIDHYSFEV